MAKDLRELAFINEDGILVDPVGGIEKNARRDAFEILHSIHAAGFLCDRRKANLKISDKNHHAGKELYEYWCDLVDQSVTACRGTKRGSLSAQFPAWEAETETENVFIRI